METASVRFKFIWIRSISTWWGCVHFSDHGTIFSSRRWVGHCARIWSVLNIVQTSFLSTVASSRCPWRRGGVAPEKMQLLRAVSCGIWGGTCSWGPFRGICGICAHCNNHVMWPLGINPVLTTSAANDDKAPYCKNNCPKMLSNQLVFERKGG